MVKSWIGFGCALDYGKNEFEKEKQNELISRLLKILQTNVIPAYDRLLNILPQDLSNATTDHGVWKLPNGDKYYKLCLEYHTTTNMSPDEVYEQAIEFR
ncbi:unnamed protein product [Rotaria sp. Silwood2]|nr:unnamed protein product [Rotaria sp. Silwood2]